MLEFVTVAVCTLLITGVVFPWTALILGSLYFIFSLVYKFSFAISPEKRVIGNVIRQLSALGLLVMSIVTSIIWAVKSPMGEDMPEPPFTGQAHTAII